MVTGVISKRDGIFDREIKSQQFVIDRIDVLSIRSIGTDFISRVVILFLLERNSIALIDGQGYLLMEVRTN